MPMTTMVFQAWWWVRAGIRLLHPGAALQRGRRMGGLAQDEHGRRGEGGRPRGALQDTGVPGPKARYLQNVKSTSQKAERLPP